MTPAGIGLKRDGRRLARSAPGAAAIVAVLFAAATVVIAVLSGLVGGAAAPVYLIPVVAAAILSGTTWAIAATVLAVGLFDVLFTDPRFTLTMSDPQDLIDLVVFLFVAVVVGRLAALLADRAEEAHRRAAEAQALFAVSRELATAPSLEAALPHVLARLASDAEMSGTWVTLGLPPAERVVAEAGQRPETPSGAVATLARSADERPAWVRTRESRGRATGPTDASVYRVKLEGDGEVLGSLWGARPRDMPEPGRSHSRLLALAADQIALGVRREALGRAASGAEVARESDRMKSALLDSVSHDLRTPLAGIRALAGGLMDPEITPTPEARRAAAAAIDAEAQRLDRLVRDLLDASRIGAGGLRPNLEACDLEGLVVPVVARFRPRFGDRGIETSIPDDLPPVWADPLFVEQVVANLLENVLRHAGPAAAARVSAVVQPAAATTDGLDAPAPSTVPAPSNPVSFVDLVVEDGGVGLAEADREAVFGATRRPTGSTRVAGPARRGGLGLGIGIVIGLTEALGGRVEAEPSPLGGLAVRVSLPAVPAPSPEDGE